MQLTASDIVSLYRPEPCSLRVYLREQGIPEAEAGAYDQIIEKLGQRHEAKPSRHAGCLCGHQRS